MRKVLAVVVTMAVLRGGKYLLFERTRPHDVPISAVAVQGPAVLVVTVRDAAPPCATDLRVSVEEDAAEVRLTARLRRDGDATCPAILHPHTAFVPLREPLGNRRVVDDTVDIRIHVGSR